MKRLIAVMSPGRRWPYRPRLAAADYVALAPVRLLDTRNSSKPVADSTIQLQVTGGTANVPVDASAVVLNVTGVAATASGFVTVWPCGTPRPNASNLNLPAQQTVPNLVISKVGTGGKVCLFTSSGTHLLADLAGYPPATPNSRLGATSLSGKLQPQSARR